MTVKNILLGGAVDYDPAGDRVKPTDLNDTFDASAGFLSWCAANFNDTVQNIFNADYLGFDSRLNNDGVPPYKNIFYSTFTSDDADDILGFEYDSTNDLYKTLNLDGFYVIVEATSISGTGLSYSANDCSVSPFGTGKWIITCTTGTDEVKRAQVMKSLFFGTNATDQLVLEFTSISAIKSPDARDTGKQAHYAYAWQDPSSSSPGGDGAYTGTFVNTSTNNDCSSWSKVYDEHTGGASQWHNPSGTTLNSVSNGTSDEFGTDTSADETGNPSTCKINFVAAIGDIQYAHAVILCSGDITWAATGSYITNETNIDFLTDESIPLFTLSEISDVEESYIIFKDTVLSTDNAIAVINSTIDATSSEQISISADSGSNWEDVDNAELARLTSGTGLWRKIVVTRTDLTKEDKVTEQAVKYNII